MLLRQSALDFEPNGVFPYKGPRAFCATWALYGEPGWHSRCGRDVWAILFVLMIAHRDLQVRQVDLTLEPSRGRNADMIERIPRVFFPTRL